MTHLSPRRALVPLLGVALMGLAAGPALAQASSGHHSPVAHHSKKKAKKKKPTGTQVIVHCASVGVTCKGKPGPAGAQGPAGAPGAPGVNGASVILRVRGGGGTALAARSESCATILCGATIPVSPNIWTEGASEDNQFVGTVTLQIPSEAACGDENTSSKTLEPDEILMAAQVDGKIEGIAEIKGATGETTVTTPILFDLGIEGVEAAAEGIGPGFLIGSGASQTHLLSVQGEDDCKTAVHATVTSLAIDVLGFS